MQCMAPPGPRGSGRSGLFGFPRSMEKIPLSPIAKVEERTINHALRLQFGKGTDEHAERNITLPNLAAKGIHTAIPLRDDHDRLEGKTRQAFLVDPKLPDEHGQALGCPVKFHYEIPETRSTQGECR